MRMILRISECGVRIYCWISVAVFNPQSTIRNG